MRKLVIRWIWLVCLLCSCMVSFPRECKAATSNKISTKLSGKSIAKRSGPYTYRFVKQSSASKNRAALNKLLNNNQKKIIILPKGTIHISGILKIGSNTILKASGATIIQNSSGRGYMINTIDSRSSVNYNLVKNVTIDGGTWRKRNNSRGVSCFRFAHGRNITIKNARINTNFQGHGIELIACADSLVENCRVMASNNRTKSRTSVEEAIQIDVASRTTAPGVYSESGHKSRYVNGQVCKNITIRDCTAYSSRGICVNCCKTDSRILKKIHRNISIINCTAIGNSAEGIMVFNTRGLRIANNTIETRSKRNNSYSTGLHLVNFSSYSSIKKGSVEITGNKIKGRYFGLAITSKTRAKWGSTTIKGNRIYCKKGKKRAIVLGRGEIKSVKSSKNSYGK